MTNPRVLVVSFSRTGNTAEVGEDIRRALEHRGIECDSERLYEYRERGGLAGYLRSVFDALSNRRAHLKAFTRDLSRYDLVVVGTPVWASSASTPIRTFLADRAGDLKRVAFFLTHGGSGRRRAFDQMRRLAGRPPVAELAIREKEIAGGQDLAKVRSFVGTLVVMLEQARTRAPRAGVTGVSRLN